MPISAFNAKCPVEIGDKVNLMGKQATITDIACIHYIKSGKVEFEYELNGNGQYIGFTFFKEARDSHE
jgi:hypothetical protein